MKMLLVLTKVHRAVDHISFDLGCEKYNIFIKKIF